MDVYYQLISSLATSMHVKWIFSKARILLSHIRNRLSIQSTQALLCVGAWSRLGYVKMNEIKGVLGPCEDDTEENGDDVGEGWDAIVMGT